MSINSGNQMRAKRTQNANQNENKQSKKINLQTGVSVAHYTSQAKSVGSAESFCPLKIKIGRHSLLPLCPMTNENYN